MEESPSFATADSAAEDARYGKVTRFAFGLGAVAILAALTIGYVTHRFAISAAEERYHNFYLSEARTLVAAAKMQAGGSDDEVLSAIAELWNASADRPPDEYLCVVDREATLILHSANPATVGNDAGKNLIAGNETRPACTLRDLVQDAQDYVGGYVSSAGQQQIAAFASVPHRGWVIGIHRSKAALETEIRSGVRLLAIGFLAVCGLLMPASLALMAHMYKIAQRKRRQAEAKEIGLGRILEDSLNEIYILSASTLRYIEVNRGARINLGYTMEELVKLTPLDLMPEFSRERLADLIRPLRSGDREKIQFETVHRRKDGTRYDITVHLQLAALGSLPVFVAIILDVSLRKRAEQALRRSEERLGLAVRGTSDGLWDAELETGEEYWSPRFKEMLGYGEDEIEATYDRFLALLHPEDKADASEAIRRHLEENQPYDHEFRLRTKCGEYRWFQSRGEALRDEQGRPYRMAGSIRDITDRRRAEEALRESEGRLSLMMQQSPSVLEVYDVNGLQVDVNKAYEELWGFPAEHTVNQFNVLESRQVEATGLLEYVKRAYAGEAVKVPEYEFDSRGETEGRGRGRIRWLNTRIYPLKDSEGSVHHIVITHEDITERKRAEQERRELETQLRQSQKMEAVGRLAGGVAHDFNNILTAILGNVELSIGGLRGELGSDHIAVQSMEQIEQAAQRAAALTRQLLTFSRRDVMQPKVLDLNRILKDLGKMLRRLITENIALELVTDSELQSVRADAGQIEQVIVNLVVNAADAMPDGGKLTLETQNVTLDQDYTNSHADARPGPYVLLAVSDTGHGMDAATRERIFEPFFTTKPVDKGTGLGLATVHGIVKQSGGHIMVYSEVGRGTTFKVYLPAIEATPDDQTPTSQPDALPRGHETVLLCEDDRPVRELIARSLQIAGYTVITAGSGQEGIEAAEAHDGSIDLLITDVIMPNMNGRALAERLRRTFPGLPTLFISGYTSNVIAHHGVLDEHVEFLEKPFTRLGLLAKVRAALGESRSDT